MLCIFAVFYLGLNKYSVKFKLSFKVMREKRWNQLWHNRDRILFSSLFSPSFMSKRSLSLPYVFVLYFQKIPFLIVFYHGMRAHGLMTNYDYGWRKVFLIKILLLLPFYYWEILQILKVTHYLSHTTAALARQLARQSARVGVFGAHHWFKTMVLLPIIQLPSVLFSFCSSPSNPPPSPH